MEAKAINLLTKNNRRSKVKLELGIIPINDMKFGNKTAVNGTCLEVNKAELEALIKEDPLVTGVELHIAKPGDNTRIIPVKDVLGVNGVIASENIKEVARYTIDGREGGGRREAECRCTARP